MTSRKSARMLRSQTSSQAIGDERWEAWKADLKQAAGERGLDIDPDRYRDGYDIGYSPDDVLQEDEDMPSDRQTDGMTP
jgi:hypothetical protein